MNDLLELRGDLESKQNSSSFILRFPNNKKITVSMLRRLEEDLTRLSEYWHNETILPGILISVYYNRVIPKSSRISRLFSKNSESPDMYIRGVRFDDSDGKKHIITYYLSKDIFEKSIEKIRLVIQIIEMEFNGVLDSEKFDKITRKTKFLQKYSINQSLLKTLILDFLDIEKFDVYHNVDKIDDKNMYITLFDTGMAIEELMNKLEIKNTEYEIFSNDTIYCRNSNVLKKVRATAPYLISMAMRDLATYDIEKENDVDFNVDFLNSPDPNDEPTIGVIDTLFDERVYFSRWVEYHNFLGKHIPIDQEDYWHGTCVDSIIVDGGRINNKWDDECGMFKVRHFGVAKAGVNSSYDIINKIRQIVESNLDIHVWNISLGSKYEISESYISPEAAVLDELQDKYNIVFVVAGTNKDSNNESIRIGAPADSINALTVNSVDSKGYPASYSRRGKVLSFFIKPDICTFGGDSNELMNVCSPSGHMKVCGTSFAAPWISRKLCFLIDKMGLSREIAKALIIDSAVGWKHIADNVDYLGHGIVPTKIQDVMLGKKDEIKFFIEGTSKSFSTYTYNIPVPVIDNKFPFYAKAVLCYFPKCTRSQGVDYTNTELDLQFGRMWKGKVKSINRNTQGGIYERATNENAARELFRKWDNTKIVIDEIKERRIARETDNNSNLWGLEIKNKSRLARNLGIKFGIVVTLKEMNGKNRNREFIDQCNINKWIVNRINIENMLDVNAIANQEIEFD